VNGIDAEFLLQNMSELFRSQLVFQFEYLNAKGFRIQCLWIDPVYMLLGISIPGEV